MTSARPDDSSSGAGNARPWGFVSAEVRQLAKGEVFHPSHAVQRLVLVTGSLAVDGAAAITAFAEPVDATLPLGQDWTVLALTEAKLVLYTEEKRKVWS